jgi:hypothetical protein
MNINHQGIAHCERNDEELLRRLAGAPGCGCEGRHDTDAEDVGCCESRGGQGRAGNSISHDDTCQDGCGRGGAFGVRSSVLAALYIPLQEFDDLYDEKDALAHGTLFRGLNLPFVGAKGGNCHDDQR